MNDERTIQAIAARDERAIRRVMDQYSRLLWSVAGGVLQGVGTEEDLEECVADVYVFLWMHPEKFDPLRGSLKSYLAMVARSRALNRRRQLTRQDALPLEELSPSQEPAAEDPEQTGPPDEALRHAMNALGEPDREVLVRRYYYDQKPKEIAAVLRLPVKQIENRLYRAKRFLRDRLTF